MNLGPSRGAPSARPEQHIAWLARRRVPATRAGVQASVLNQRFQDELPPDSYVFGGATGKMISRRKANTLWRETGKDAGIADLHVDDLRHEAGSPLLEAAAAIHEVRDALGHTTIGMTSCDLNTNQAGLKSALEKRSAMRLRHRMKVVAS